VVAGRLVAILILLGVSVPSLTWRLSTCPPPWFDEGLRTNLARTVVERGVYGTATVEGIHAFDPATSTGPADIGLIAASFRLFGIGTVQARAPIALFGIVGILFLYLLAAWLWGERAALVVALVALAMPRLQHVNLIAMARQVMGETPSMALGFASLWLLFRSWEGGRLWSAGLAGAAAMLAFYSKGQEAITGLLPAIAVAEWARSRRHGFEWPRLASLCGGAAVVGGVWWGVQLASTTPELRRENLDIIRDQVWTQFLILGPRAFIAGTWRVFAVLAAAFALGAALLARRWQPLHAAPPQQFALLGLLAGLGTTAVWYIGLSTGWARYAYFGLALGGLFLGQTGYEMLSWLRRRWPAAKRRLYPAAVVSLAISALAVNLSLLRTCPETPFAREMAERIRALVAPDEVVESSEWEVDALSGHWNYHHPTQRETTQAIAHFTAGRRPELSYDALAADPDYLLAGTFSGYCRLYDADMVKAHFQLVETIGPYRLWRRDR
jgi:hypothetical protein